MQRLSVLFIRHLVPPVRSVVPSFLAKCLNRICCTTDNISYVFLIYKCGIFAKAGFLFQFI